MPCRHNAIASAIVHDEPLDFDRVEARLPGPLATAVRKALAKDPAERPASAAEFLLSWSDVPLVAAESGAPRATTEVPRRPSLAVLPFQNVTGDETRAVRLSVKKGELHLFGQSAGYGEATAQMEADFKGSPTDIAFNPDYVQDGLKNCETSVVRLEFNDKSSPGKFTLGENYVYVVMPITIDA